LHLSQTSQEARDWIKSQAGIPEPEAQALIADHARPRCVQTETGLLFIGRGMNLDEGSLPEDMKSIRVWIEKDRIITVVKRRMRSVETLAALFSDENHPDSPASVLVALFSMMTQRIAPFVQDLGDRLDEIQFSVIDDSVESANLPDLSPIRLRTVGMHRYLVPLYDAAVSLCNAEQLTRSKKVLAQASLTRDQLARIVDELAAIEAKAAVTRDEMVSLRAEKLNERVYNLTVLAAIFLPLTVLTGLLGMNVGGIPLMDNNYGFLLMSAALVIIMTFTILLLRKIRWI
jgi:zinc transporter